MALFSIRPDLQISAEIFGGVLPQTTFFVHGNLASNNWWLPSLEVWKKKKAEATPGSMILAEFRGCGKSTPPQSLRDVDMRLFAQDFIALVEGLQSGKLAAAIKGPYNLVGHSTGGLICALMAASRPGLFNRVLLLDSVGAHGVSFDDSMKQAFDQMKASKDLTAAVIGSTILNNDPNNEFFKTKIVEDAFYAVKTVGSWVLESLKGFNGEAELSKVRNKTLVLHGENDVLLPRQDSEKMAKIMHAEFKLIPGQGHCCNFENPAKFVEIAHQFLF
ncbi:MAG: alpha/beta hydrolase [Bdellovibrio sp.]|nr:MAG: alpha/beta hydrolase [Bdellovibrio sp.]